VFLRITPTALEEYSPVLIEFRDARLELRHTSVLGAGIPTNAYLTFLKTLLLALHQIYKRAFRLWKTIDWRSVWVGHSCQYQLSFLS